MAGARHCASGLVAAGVWTAWLLLLLLLAFQGYIASVRELEVPRFLLHAIEDHLAQSGVSVAFGRAIFDPSGRVLARAGSDSEEILSADIDPELARRKRLVRVPLRHEINRIADRILQRFKSIGQEENVEISCTKPDFHAPALTAPVFQDAIRVSARQAGLATLDLPSGAGHDAQNVARFSPVGMIFVPSRGGISHSPLEYTSPEQAANGAEVLYRTLLRLDAQLDASAAVH